MPQNNQDITNSQEFKDFRKDNNLEVLNLEAICVLLFQFQERQNEIAKVSKLPYPGMPEMSGFYGDTITGSIR